LGYRIEERIGWDSEMNARRVGYTHEVTKRCGIFGLTSAFV
jgi:hypothetical protein